MGARSQSRMGTPEGFEQGHVLLRLTSPKDDSGCHTGTRSEATVIVHRRGARRSTF